MMLNVSAIADRGDRAKERIVLKATADIDVGDFAVFRTKYRGDGLVSSRVTSIFWFPDKSIKSNDLVVLYTKGGTATERPASSGSGATVHFFYWGKKEALWSGSNYAPVLAFVNEWEVFSDFLPGDLDGSLGGT